jgi:hypothetical protein
MTWTLLDRHIDDLTIEDESAFLDVASYVALKETLRRDRYLFRLLPAEAARWDRALLLNLTFWGVEGGGDVLVDDVLAADIVTHAAWHHLAARALADSEGHQSAEALLLGEAIASAFDLFLVGRLLASGHASTFLETQVPAMAETALEAGLDDDAFDALLHSIAADPERAFEGLRALLFDVSIALLRCPDAQGGLLVLESFAKHPFAPLLHRYELSTWVLFARARASASEEPDEHVRAVDQALRRADVSLDWLEAKWLVPARAR